MSLPSLAANRVLRGNSSNVWDVLHSKHGSVYTEKVMNEEEWERHRRSGLRHRPRPWLFIRVVAGYATILAWVAVFSAAVGLYDSTLVKHHGWPMLTIQCVQTFFGAITFALTLLLVFKTNASYNRWQDARRAIGMLTSTAHNLARQTVGFFPAHQSQLAAAMLRWTAATMWATKVMVRQRAPLREELKNVLLPSELSWLLDQPHKALAVGQALSAILQAACMDPHLKARLDATITEYVYQFGACCRLYNTAIPAAYTRHTSRFLLCYILVGLPLLMWPLAGWGAPLLSVAIAFLVLGVENIAAYIEEPFKVLAFDAFCQNVTRDMQAVLAMLDTSADPGFGRPPLSQAVACKPPIIGGLNISMSAALEDVVTPASSASSTPPSSTTPDANIEVLRMQGSQGITPQTHPSSAKAFGSAWGANTPVVAAAPPTEAQSEELNCAPSALPAVPMSSADHSGALRYQQQAHSWVHNRRRSFDVGGVGHRRAPRPINSRTNLLTAVGGSGQDSTP